MTDNAKKFILPGNAIYLFKMKLYSLIQVCLMDMNRCVFLGFFQSKLNLQSWRRWCHAGGTQLLLLGLITLCRIVFLHQVKTLKNGKYNEDLEINTWNKYRNSMQSPMKNKCKHVKYISCISVHITV